MRIPACLALVTLSACGGGDEQKTTATAAAPAENRIECALGGSERFATTCAIERDPNDPNSLTLRHPDGGFRKLLVTSDGRGVIAGDGAARASVQVIADRRIEVAIEGDRYRLPATVKGK
ncbi:MAG TPA: hypothetical protein VF631_04810 [Allosphingosinicella sp.]|jgi:hypothetical protein|uniref:hypothetical protein n=1 Tax=Allosphingosinicella sp. TaxID=2823234 RepID=UPI002F28FAFD